MARDVIPFDKDFALNVITEAEVNQALDEFINTEFIDPTLEDVRKAYYKKLTHFPITGIPLGRSAYDKFDIFRARVINEEVEDITKVSTFGAPPPELANGGRANWPGKPVFYGADRPYGALAELKRTELGNEFYLSKWNFDLSQTENQYINIGPLLFDNMSSGNPWHVLVENKENPYQEVINEIGKEKSDSLSHLNCQVSKLFTSPNEKHYPITAFIAHQYIYSNAPEDNEVSFPIIIYPSVENKLDSCNFAIHPGFVKGYMYPTTFFHVKVTGQSYRDLTISCEKVGVSKDRKNIAWYNQTIDKSHCAYRINFVGCPSCGRIYIYDEFEKLELTHKGKSINLKEYVETYVLTDEQSPFITIPKSFMDSMVLLRSFEQTWVYVSDDATFKCEDHSHANPCINIHSYTSFHYEPLNIKQHGSTD